MNRKRWQVNFTHFYAAAFIILGLIIANYLAGSFQRGDSELKDVARAQSISAAYYDAVTVITYAQQQGQPLAVGASGKQADVQAALQDAAKSLHFLQTSGNPEDKQLVSMALGEASPEAFLSTVAFDSQRAAPAPPPSAATPPPLAPALQQLMTMAAQRHAEAQTALDQYRNSQKFQFRFTLLGFALALPLMFALLEFIRRSERRQTATQVELGHLERVALSDSLTDLGNHRSFQEQLRAQLASARRNEQPICLGVIDMDDFKSVNDSRGHAYGDRLLIGTARLLEDAVGQVAELFRVGGDEFAVLLPECDLETAFDRMRGVRSRTTSLGHTLSIGIAEASDEDDVETLREKADSALYVAKRRGRDTIWRFTEGEAAGVFSARKTAGLRRMLVDGAVKVAFQPIWLTDRKNIFGLEALTRVADEYEVSGPEEAFDIADRIGRSFDLDRLCIRSALARAGNVPSSVFLFLNIAPRTLEHAEFSVPWLLNEVRLAGLEPERVCIEITERSTAPIELLKQHTTRMRKAGFKIALDDVGSGNSGLELLREVDLDFVKVDRSVLVGALAGGASRAVLMAIIAFATEAGAHVIAEGIENEALLEYVRRVSTQSAHMRVQLLQGHYLARPYEGDPSDFFAGRPEVQAV